MLDQFKTVDDLKRSLEFAQPDQLSVLIAALLSKELTPFLSQSLPFRCHAKLLYAQDEKLDAKYYMHIRLRVKEGMDGNRIVEMSGVT